MKIPQAATRRRLLECAVTLAAVVTVLLLRFGSGATSHVLGKTEMRLVDARFAMRGPLPMENLARQVAIVGIDSQTTRRLKFPPPRSAHAQLVRALKKAGARAVLFDVLFTDPGSLPGDDADFAAACRENGNVFFPFDDAAARPAAPADMAAWQAKAAWPLGGTNIQTPRFAPPIAPLTAAARGGGHLIMRSDENGVYRHAIAVLQADAAYPQAALDMVARVVWKVDPARSGAVKMSGDSLILRGKTGEHRIGHLTKSPLPGGMTGWTLPLNFFGDHQAMQALTVPYLDAMEGRADDRLKGRLVIVGHVETGTTDLRPSPLDRGQTFLGVETNATFIGNLLANNFLRNSPPVWDVWLTAIGALLACGLVALLRPGRAIFLVGLLMAGYGYWATWIFARHNLVVELTGPLLGAVLGCMAMTSYRLVWVEGQASGHAQELERAQKLLGQALDDRLAQRLVGSPELMQEMRIGVRREVTVLFAGIRDFTQWCERHSPEEVKARLDEYFPTMCEIVHDDHGGFIDKFVGDSLMVVWNAFGDQDDHATHAVNAALSMQRALVNMNEAWQRQSRGEFHIGIGIATGRVIFGTFGDPQRKLMPTVLGDTVNVAARLEAVTKETDRGIVISERTFQMVKDGYQCVEVEGHAGFEVLGVIKATEVPSTPDVEGQTQN